MIVKGIIKSIDLNGNTCEVRMPTFETAGSDEVVAKALISNTPGLYNGYKENDVVWVGFETDSIDEPVVLGKLYLGTAKEAADPRGVSNLEVVSASKTASIPFDTKLNTSTDPKLPNTQANYASLQSVANSLNTLDNNVAQQNRDNANKFTQIYTDNENNKSELIQTANKIRATVSKKLDQSSADAGAGVTSFGWDLTYNEWVVFQESTIYANNMTGLIWDIKQQELVNEKTGERSYSDDLYYYINGRLALQPTTVNSTKLDADGNEIIVQTVENKPIKYEEGDEIDVASFEIVCNYTDELAGDKQARGAEVEKHPNEEWYWELTIKRNGQSLPAIITANDAKIRPILITNTKGLKVLGTVEAEDGHLGEFIIGKVHGCWESGYAEGAVNYPKNVITLEQYIEITNDRNIWNTFTDASGQTKHWLNASYDFLVWDSNATNSESNKGKYIKLSSTTYNFNTCLECNTGYYPDTSGNSISTIRLMDPRNKKLFKNVASALYTDKFINSFETAPYQLQPITGSAYSTGNSAIDSRYVSNKYYVFNKDKVSTGEETAIFTVSTDKNVSSDTLYYKVLEGVYVGTDGIRVSNSFRVDKRGSVYAKELAAESFNNIGIKNEIVASSENLVNITNAKISLFRRGSDRFVKDKGFINDNGVFNIKYPGDISVQGGLNGIDFTQCRKAGNNPPHSWWDAAETHIDWGDRKILSWKNNEAAQGYENINTYVTNAYTQCAIMEVPVKDANLLRSEGYNFAFDYKVSHLSTNSRTTDSGQPAIIVRPILYRESLNSILETSTSDPKVIPWNAKVPVASYSSVANATNDINDYNYNYGKGWYSERIGKYDSYNGVNLATRRITTANSQQSTDSTLRGWWDWVDAAPDGSSPSTKVFGGTREIYNWATPINFTNTYHAVTNDSFKRAIADIRNDYNTNAAGWITAGVGFCINNNSSTDSIGNDSSWAQRGITNDDLNNLTFQFIILFPKGCGNNCTVSIKNLRLTYGLSLSGYTKSRADEQSNMGITYTFVQDKKTTDDNWNKLITNTSTVFSGSDESVKLSLPSVVYSDLTKDSNFVVTGASTDTQTLYTVYFKVTNNNSIIGNTGFIEAAPFGHTVQPRGSIGPSGDTIKSVTVYFPNERDQAPQNLDEATAASIETATEQYAGWYKTILKPTVAKPVLFTAVYAKQTIETVDPATAERHTEDKYTILQQPTKYETLNDMIDILVDKEAGVSILSKHVNTQTSTTTYALKVDNIDPSFAMSQGVRIGGFYIGKAASAASEAESLASAVLKTGGIGGYAPWGEILGWKCVINTDTTTGTKSLSWERVKDKTGIPPTDKSGVLISTNGIQLGDKFVVDSNGNLLADSGSIGGCEIIDGTLKIKAANITDKLTAANIAAGAITTDHMVANSINGDRIQVGTISANKIKAGELKADKIEVGTPNAKILYADSTKPEETVIGGFTVSSSSLVAKKDNDQVNISTSEIVLGSASSGVKLTNKGEIWLGGLKLSVVKWDSSSGGGRRASDFFETIYSDKESVTVRYKENLSTAIKVVVKKQVSGGQGPEEVVEIPAGEKGERYKITPRYPDTSTATWSVQSLATDKYQTLAINDVITISFEHYSDSEGGIPLPLLFKDIACAQVSIWDKNYATCLKGFKKDSKGHYCAIQVDEKNVKYSVTVTGKCVSTS